MKVLKIIEMLRKIFDPSAPKLIPQHRLAIWPGYVSAVDEYEGGKMFTRKEFLNLCKRYFSFRRIYSNIKENALILFAITLDIFKLRVCCTFW